MNKATAVLGVMIAFVGGYFLGHYTTKGSKNNGSASSGSIGHGGDGEGAAGNPSAAAPGEAAKGAAGGAANGDERYKVDIGDAPVKGSADALVTIVEFSDFECPFCGRAHETMTEVSKAYGDKVRIVFKQNPLPFHPNAKPGAKAALAAAEQGKFWEMHDLIFSNQQDLGHETFLKYAAKLGLDEAKFKTSMDSDKWDSIIDHDMKEAAAIGARGTPTFYVNGILVRGAQPLDAFKQVIDKEIASAEKMVQGGIAKNQVYAELMKSARTSPPPEPTAQAQPGQPDPSKTYKVELGTSPVKGSDKALVTIIEWSDFECPFCSRVGPTIKQIEDTYGDKVRIAFKNQPLPMHPDAPLAAEAGLAAAEQGKFWQLHDAMFADQQGLSRAGLEAKAEKIGLDMGKFKAALDSGKFKQQIAADQAQASKFGVRGTPSFYINGRPLRGAQPFESFKTVIDEELKKAEALKGQGVSGADAIYARTIDNGLTEVAAAPPPPPAGAQPGEPDEAKTYAVAFPPTAPSIGDANAKITVVMWSDFQCPFCSRVEPTIKQLRDKYGKDLRVVWRDYPLPFHDHAEMAAEAGRAAHEQGKFWQMHEKMFANQQNLDRAHLEQFAQEIGLDMNKFKSALDSGKFKQGVADDIAYGGKFGVNGTPSFYVNGRFVGGAVPFEMFDGKVQEVMKEADAKLKSGTSAAQLYNEVTKGGLTEVAAAPPQAPGAPQAPPPDDNKVYDVAAGDGPAKGPASAKVTIIEFSDFQCPFCGRVTPTVKQIMDTYGNKVHFVFRNMPLPFHDKAQLAAEAGLAANAQGKFWQMHDAMFANQDKIDRAGLEATAEKIGLDMGKFKADLDSGKWKARVQADIDAANKLGGLGTPTFFVNGKKIEGAVPFEQFKAKIDAALM
jgi:protein-disulfide isomerase